VTQRTELAGTSHSRMRQVLEFPGVSGRVAFG